MITTILLVMLWLLIAFHLVGGLLSFFSAMRYRDVAAWLDAGRLGHQPFQPRISLIVRCDLRTTVDCVSKIWELLSLNYIQYEVIVLTDASADSAAFSAIVAAFELERTADGEATERGGVPIRGRYRSSVSLYRRLTLIDREESPGEDPLRTARSVAWGQYTLFIDSLDNELSCDSLANLAILKMRDTADRVGTIRSVGRYDCRGRFASSFFRLMAELCNLRRIYIIGPLRGVDHGRFMILRDTSGRRDGEEFVPQPQMLFHRPNRPKTYLEQLSPRGVHTSPQGRIFVLVELSLCLTFWGVGIHAFLTPGAAEVDLLFLLTVYLLPVSATAFSILIGEIVLKRDYDIRQILFLLLLMPLEALVFCLLLPLVRLSGMGRRRPAHGA